MSCFIIAEAGVNHNGSLEMALRLVDEAAHAGADAIKFQTFKAEELVSPFAEKAEYQKKTTGKGTQFEMLQSLELKPQYHEAIVARCAKLGIEFMSTAFSPGLVDFLIQLGVKRLKLPSGEITNIPLLEHLAKKDMPLIMSTGMATLDEVKEAIAVIKAVRLHEHFTKPLDDMLIVLHCTSNYPTKLEDVNLRAMQSIASTCNLRVGYSDHTEGILIPPVAVAMGACVIEKHFTLDKRLPGPDHQASLEPQELQQLVKDIRAVEKSLGGGEKKPCHSELPVRDIARRSVTLRRALSKGVQLSLDDIELLRPGTGIPPAQMSQVIRKKLKQDLAAGTTLQWDHLED